MSADGILSGAGDCIQACAGTDAIKGCAGACTCAASGIPCYTITINAGTQIYGGYYFRWAAQTIVVTNQGGYCHWSGCWNLEYSPDNSTWTAATGACWLVFDTGCYFAIFMQTAIGGVTYWVGAGKRTLSPGYNQMPDGGYSPWDGAWTDMGWVVGAFAGMCAYADVNITTYGGAPGHWGLVDSGGRRVCVSGLGCVRSEASGGGWAWDEGSPCYGGAGADGWGVGTGLGTIGVDRYGQLYAFGLYPGQTMCVVDDCFAGDFSLVVLRCISVNWVACDWGCPEPEWTPAADPPCEEGTSPPTPPAPCTVTGTPPDLPPSKHCRTIWKVQWNDEDGGHNRAKPGSWSAYGLVSQICTLAAPTSPIAMTDDAWVGPSGGWYYYSQLHTETCSVNADCTSYGTEPTTYPA